MYISQTDTGYNVTLNVSISLLDLQDHNLNTFDSHKDINTNTTLIVSIKNIYGIYQEQKIVQAIKNDKQTNQFSFPSFPLRFLFEVLQPLKLDLKINSQFIGSCQTTLSQIISKTTKLQLVDLINKSTGKVTITTEICKKNQKNIRFDIKLELYQTFIENLLWVFHQHELISITIYKKIPYKQIIHQTIPQNRWTLYWPKIQSTFEILCDDDPLQSIHCEGKLLYILVISHEGQNQRTLGEFEFWLYHFDKGYFNFDITNNSKIIGKATIEHYTFDPYGSFYKYIQKGLQLQLLIAIDFTESNNNLHIINTDNQYLNAIQAVTQILMDYDHDKRVPMYGFGGIPKYMYKYNKHCFPLTGDELNCEATSLDEIIEIYKFGVKNIKFDGPTYFSPIIKKGIHYSKIDQNNYYILLILTDGKYMDEDQIIECLVDAAKLPLSLIIVGIGNQFELENMDILDKSNGLVDQMGRKVVRNLVKHVNFNHFKNDQRGLAAELLDELPNQVVEYFQLINLEIKQL